MARLDRAIDAVRPFKQRRRGCSERDGAASTISTMWRIDDGWWRPSPIARTYFQISLENGHVLILYRDDLDGTWWPQR